mmetsp:Transcript_20270/g.46767  ORF Transcript_20270/g.46767 Transcript_20270/m.46767 type:complete len:210 (-) Transcript_20270:450-1079(-)
MAQSSLQPTSSSCRRCSTVSPAISFRSARRLKLRSSAARFCSGARQQPPLGADVDLSMQFWSPRERRLERLARASSVGRAAISLNDRSSLTSLGSSVAKQGNLVSWLPARTRLRSQQWGLGASSSSGMMGVQIRSTEEMSLNDTSSSTKRPAAGPHHMSDERPQPERAIRWCEDSPLEARREVRAEIVPTAFDFGWGSNASMADCISAL